MRAATGWLIAILALPLAGCFDFDVPLGPPKLPVDARLLGDWRCIGFDSGSDADKTVHLQFKQLDPARYEITSPDMCDNDDCPAVFRAHSTRVGDATILNAQLVRKDGTIDSKWNYARARLYQPNVLHLDLVDDEAFKDVAQTSEALSKALGKRMKAPGVFTDYTICARIQARFDKPH